MDGLQAPLRVLISSTPKTGNTWLFHLLASLYDLPRLGLLVPFNRTQADGLGDRWAAFHHMRPEPELLDWIESARPVLLTTLRHPGDVLISLYHHVNEFEKSGENLEVMRSMLHDPFDRKLIEPFERNTFADELAVSIAWRRAGARVVRYEDLWRDPVETLQGLTSLLGPVSPERIERAVERCDFDLMRKLAGEHGRFFRAGRVGDWRHSLSSEILGDLASEPYRTQMEELGYTLDPSDPRIAAPARPRPQLNPFRDAPHFENGVAVAPIIIDCYLSRNPESTAAWGKPTRTGPGSFYEWLNAQSDLGGDGIYASLPLSNLALYAYQHRPDVEDAFPRIGKPDVAGFVSERANYAEWFVRRGEAELGLEPAQIEPVRAALLAWGNARSPEDTEDQPWWPVLTNFALHVYRSRADARNCYPDVFGVNRWRYLEWLVANSLQLNLYPGFVSPLRAELESRRGLPRDGILSSPTIAELFGRCTPEFRSRHADFSGWLNDPVELGGRDMYSGLRISNLAYYIYRNRQDLIDAFPDLSGPDGANYAEWFVRNGEIEFQLDAAFLDPVRAGLLAWANARSPRDTVARFWWPRLTNFALHLYHSRPDLQRAYPDVLAKDRWNFLQWTVDNTADLNLYPAMVDPIRHELTRVRSIRKLGTDWPFRVVKRYFRRDSGAADSRPSLTQQPAANTPCKSPGRTPRTVE